MFGYHVVKAMYVGTEEEHKKSASMIWTFAVILGYCSTSSRCNPSSATWHFGQEPSLLFGMALSQVVTHAARAQEINFIFIEKFSPDCPFRIFFFLNEHSY